MEKIEKHILLASPTMHGEEIKYVQEAFDKNWVAPLGFNCDNFEIEMQKFINDDIQCLALSAGTAALHLAFKLAGVKRGDVVLCSDMTFAATVNPVVYEGGVPVFIDSEYESWNMNPDALEKAFEKYPNAKVVVIAHLYGTPSKMDEIMEVCKKHNAILVEDAAEALGASYKGRACGTFGDLAALSFNGNKIITTSGGGMLITKTIEQKKKALFWATQARENATWYQHEEIGYNYRMSNIVAGIGRGQLPYTMDHVAKKEAIYKRYVEGFKGLPITVNPYLKDTKPNFWLSCLLINKGEKVTFMDIYNKLKDMNVESRPIWKPMHMQPVYKNNDFISVAKEPVNEDIFSRGLCLPSDIKMTEEEQNYVIDVIKSCFAK